MDIGRSNELGSDGPRRGGTVKQLGLKLESAKVPAEIVVIDGAQKPSEN
jgi:uncharacterized protein (TIGR03435 family)